MQRNHQGMEMAERRVSESDVNRLRYALLKDLVEDAYNPNRKVQLQGLLFLRRKLIVIRP